MSDNLDMPDDAKIILGTGDDLQLYHNGTINVIKTMSGSINIRYSGQEMIVAEPSGAVELYYNNSLKLATTSTTVSFSGHARPSANDTYDVGLNGYKWDDVYATNGTIQTSDRNTKNTIVDSDLGLSFINKLKPVSYKFNNKTRTHYGLIAQDIETILSDISKSTVDFAGFIKEDLPDDLYNKDDTLPEGKKIGDVKIPAYTTYGLRYSEFISPLIKAVQELSAEVNTLKTKVAALEGA